MNVWDVMYFLRCRLVPIVLPFWISGEEEERNFVNMYISLFYSFVI